MIRFAVQSDLEEIVAASREFYDEICLDAVGYRFDEPRIRESYQSAIEFKGHYCLLYTENCKILGLFLFSIRDDNHFFTNKRFASEIVWHSLPSLNTVKRIKVMIKLFEAMEMYAINVRKATGIYVGLDARRDFAHRGINRYLEKRGYGQIVSTYYKGANHEC